MDFDPGPAWRTHLVARHAAGFQDMKPLAQCDDENYGAQYLHLRYGRSSAIPLASRSSLPPYIDAPERLAKLRNAATGGSPVERLRSPVLRAHYEGGSSMRGLPTIVFVVCWVRSDLNLFRDVSGKARRQVHKRINRRLLETGFTRVAD